VRKFGLLVNPSIKGAVDVSIEVIEFLKDKVELVITKEHHKQLKNKIELKNITTSELEHYSEHDMELLIAIGGDGTILRTLHKCNFKIFGINAGVVGFLTEVQMEDAIESLERILNKNYIIDDRMRLETRLNERILEPAMNEAVIHTADIAKMRLYLIRVDGIEAQTVRADGIIIATPTGSTSYAMSAGGPILDPKVNAILIVPIAPFKLSARPLVVPSTSEVSIEIIGTKRNSILVIDGQVKYKLVDNDILTFTRAKTSAEFIRFQPNFYRLIDEKLTTQ
jgi:NAD+ kinase